MNRNTPKSMPYTAELGLPDTTGWYVTATLFVFGGALVFALSLTGYAPEAAQTPDRIAALLAIALAPLWFIAGHRRVSEKWLHPPIFLGAGLVAFVALDVTQMRGPLLIIFALPMLPAAYMLPIRHAVPHVALGAILTIVYAGLADDPYAATRQVIFPVVVVGTAVMLMATQQHLRRVAAIHRELSETDPLTGVANVRRLQIRLDEELARAQRAQTAFALFAIDLDDFKEVNDKHGYSIGDQLLTGVARAIQEELRPVDLLVRRGGDEFLVLTPLIGGRDFEELAGRLRQTIESARLEICADVRPAASVGWAVSHPLDSPEAIIRRADDALHDKKLQAHPERTGSKSAGSAIHASLGQPSRAGDGVDSLHNVPETLGANLERAPRLDSRANNQLVAGGAASMLAITGALTVLVAGSFGVDPAMTRPGVVLSAVAVALIVPLHMWSAGKRLTGRKTAHLVMLATITMIATGLAAAGEARVGALELLLPTIFFVFYFTRPARAVPYAAFNLGLYGYFLLSSDYEDANAHLMMTAAVVSMLAGMFALARHRTRQFAHQNALLSQTDPLTGLANLRRLRDRLTDEIERCRCFGESFTLMMLDLDDFKSVNDVYNHTVGDTMLSVVASTIRDQVRADELAARRGGDEFAIVLTSLDETGADAFAERIDQAIGEMRADLCPDLISTTSVGWVSWVPDEPADVLLQRADLALHRAKQSSHRDRRGDPSIEPECSRP